MKIILTLLISLSLFLEVNAQQIIRGTVTDRDSKIPLIGAAVYLIGQENEYASITNENGEFSLSGVPTGRCGIEATYLGYETLRQEELLVTEFRELVINLEMEESINELNTIEVTSSRSTEPLNELTTVSGLSFTMEALERQAANFADPARMALNFPGVVFGGDDVLNELVIRGNAPSGMLWRLEGIEIPNPNHFATRGGSGGGITMLSANAMSTSDFFTGAFPAEYGNALSGVMDIRMRNGNYHQRELMLQVGLLGLDLEAEGPFKKGYEGSYMLNYRYSTLGILDQLGITPAGSGIPDFQDLSFKLHLPTEKGGTFNIFGLGGSFIEDELITDRPDGGAQYRDKGRTGIIGLSHLYFISNKTYLKSVIAASRAKLVYDESFGDPLVKRYDETFRDDANRISLLLNHKFNAKHLIRIGGIASRLGYELKMEEEGSEIKFENGTPKRVYTGEWFTFLNDKGNAYLYQSYLQWKGNVLPKLTLNTGLHFTHFELNDDSVIEPRFGIKYKLSNRHELSIGAGMHSRTEALATYFIRRLDANGDEFQPHKNLPLQRSQHLVLGHRMKLNNAWTLSTEAYYQRLSNMPVSNNPNSTIAALNVEYFDLFFNPIILVGKGEGINYGIDINLDRRFYRQFYLIVNASIFNSEYKTLAGQWYNTRFNTGYNLLVAGGKEWTIGKKNRTLSANVRFLLNGGQRYTPIDREQSIANQTTIFERIPYSKNLPVYQRLDFGISYRIPVKRFSQVISLNIQNVTDRLNVYERNQRYDERVADKIRIFDELQTGMIPILNYRLEF